MSENKETLIKIEFEYHLSNREIHELIEKIKIEFKDSVKILLNKHKVLFFSLDCDMNILDWSSYLDFDNPDGWVINKIEENISGVNRVLGQVIIFKDKVKKLVVGLKQYFPKK